MYRSFAFLICFLFPTQTVVAASTPEVSPWGKEHFTNPQLTTHDGKKVRFFDDLIKDKIVAINFIYTTCPDTCPLETARMVRVQKILKDRVGKDVFFYSITIDPENDTPAVLKGYRDRFKAKWPFLTGNKKEIDTLRKRLGLYIANIDGGNNNHNVSMIIGNQKTGRWMKRSPFENAHVLADQIGNWLEGWRRPQRGGDYAQAPELRNISEGEQLFRTRCVSCHSIDGSHSSSLGPDLMAVTERRKPSWLVRWLRNPERMLKDKDPVALALDKKYPDVEMPNFRLTGKDIAGLLTFFKKETARNRANPPAKPAEVAAAGTKLDSSDVVAIMNAWVRDAGPKAKVNAGYLTMINASKDPLIVTGITSEHFDKVEIHEMAMEDGLMVMREVENLKLAPMQPVKLAPGGKHLMLKRPTQVPISGGQVPVVISFEDGRKQKILMQVKGG